MVFSLLTDRRVKHVVIIFLVFMFSVTLFRGRGGGRGKQTQYISPSPCFESDSASSNSTGCILESSHDPDRPPNAVKFPPNTCNFFTEYFQRAYCNVEWDTHLLVKQIIRPTDIVLEVGGRYGSTTCAVAVEQNNSGALIVVEPDTSVWAIHEFNKLTHNCASWTIFGVLGGEDLTVLADTEGYNTQTTADKGAKGVRVRHFTWDFVEKATGLKVDTVILDCEGCWIDVVRDNLEKFKNVHTVIIGKLHQ